MLTKVSGLLWARRIPGVLLLVGVSLSLTTCSKDEPNFKDFSAVETTEYSEFGEAVKTKYREILYHSPNSWSFEFHGYSINDAILIGDQAWEKTGDTWVKTNPQRAKVLADIF